MNRQYLLSSAVQVYIFRPPVQVYQTTLPVSCCCSSMTFSSHHFNHHLFSLYCLPLSSVHLVCTAVFMAARIVLVDLLAQQSPSKRCLGRASSDGVTLVAIDGSVTEQRWKELVDVARHLLLNCCAKKQPAGDPLHVSITS